MGNRYIGVRIPAGLVVLAAVLFCVPALQVHGDVPVFTEDLSPNPVGKNGRFTYTIILERESSEEVVLEIPELPEGIFLYRGPSISPVWVQLENGTYIRKVRITTIFRAEKEGKTVFGGFTLRVEEDETRTGYHLVRVGYRRNRSLVVPYEPEWVIPGTPIYTGQAVPVILMVRNMEEVILFDRVSVDQPAGAMFERVSGIGAIESRTIGDITLYDIPASSFILTPSGPGEVILPEARVEAGEVSGQSSVKRIEVLPLPEEVQSTGAVGTFTYSTEPVGANAVEGSELSLTLRVSGQGNLNFLEIPAPSVQGLTLVSRNDEGDFSASEDGYRGQRKVTYLYLPETPGQVVIKTADFPFITPVTGEIQTIRGRQFAVSVAPVSKTMEEDSGAPSCPFELLEKRRPHIFSGAPFYSEPGWIFALLPGPLVLLILIIVRKRSGKVLFVLIILFSGCSYDQGIQKELISVEDEYQAGNYDRAMETCEGIIRNNTEDAGVIYNYALCCYKNGDVIRALQAARNAVYRSPLFFRARKLLSWIEQQGEIPGGIMPIPPYHPDMFFLLLVIGVNGACVCAILKILKKQGIYTILAILLISLSVPAGLFLWHSSRERSNPPGIVYLEDVYLLKIPSDSAGPWIRMPLGTAVKVLQETPGYYLVRDGRGVEGWIEKETLIRDSELIFNLDDGNTKG